MLYRSVHQIRTWEQDALTPYQRLYESSEGYRQAEADIYTDSTLRLYLPSSYKGKGLFGCLSDGRIKYTGEQKSTFMPDFRKRSVD